MVRIQRRVVWESGETARERLTSRTSGSNDKQGQQSKSSEGFTTHPRRITSCQKSWAEGFTTHPRRKHDPEVLERGFHHPPSKDNFLPKVLSRGFHHPPSKGNMIQKSWSEGFTTHPRRIEQCGLSCLSDMTWPFETQDKAKRPHNPAFRNRGLCPTSESFEAIFDQFACSSLGSILETLREALFICRGLFVLASRCSFSKIASKDA